MDRSKSVIAQFERDITVTVSRTGARPAQRGVPVTVDLNDLGPRGIKEVYLRIAYDPAITQIPSAEAVQVGPDLHAWSTQASINNSGGYSIIRLSGSEVLPAKPLALLKILFDISVTAPEGYNSIISASAFFTRTPAEMSEILRALAANPVTGTRDVIISNPSAVPERIDDGIINILSGTNRPPHIAALPPKAVFVGEFLTFPVIATDPDLNGTLTYSAGPLPEGASFDPHSAFFSWRPGESAAGLHVIEFTVSDGALQARTEVQVQVASTSSFQLDQDLPDALVATLSTPYGITLTWRDNSTQESGFEVERSTDAMTFRRLAALPANTTSYVDQGLDANTTYYYRVRAFKADGNTAPSEVVSATTRSIFIPSPPANIRQRSSGTPVAFN
jgi:hypothetical protein